LIVSEEIYNHNYKASHPQIKTVITIAKNIIKNILPHLGGTLPTGFLTGKTVEPLPGETARYKCTDYILTPLSSTNKYEFATPQDKAKYDKANLSGQILGKFICGSPLNGSKLENDITASLGTGKICLIVNDVGIGKQKGTRKTSSAAAEEIGVFVE